MGGVRADAAAIAADERVVKAEFTGSASEYFRVWIVNLFFTLVTFGIYSAWAKVRKRRYFYGCTRLDGDTFDYFASPKAVLRGRIVAAVIFVAYVLAGEIYPVAQFGFLAVGLLAMPWLLVKAAAFNARNSAYRGLRFDFDATPRQAARVYLGMALVVVLTAGIALPWFMARHKAFVASHHAFGTSGFRCELSGSSFFRIYFLAGLIAIAFAVPGAAISGYLSYQQISGKVNLPQSLAWLVWVLPLLPIYAGYAIAYAYAQARTANLFWSCVQGKGVRFASTLSAWGLTKLYFGNLFAVACTAGLLIPWAVVRTIRYRLANFSMIVASTPVYVGNPSLAPVGAASQELGDFFNLDVGV